MHVACPQFLVVILTISHCFLYDNYEHFYLLITSVLNMCRIGGLIIVIYCWLKRGLTFVTDMVSSNSFNFVF